MLFDVMWYDGCDGAGLRASVIVVTRYCLFAALGLCRRSTSLSWLHGVTFLSRVCVSCEEACAGAEWQLAFVLVSQIGVSVETSRPLSFKSWAVPFGWRKCDVG